MDPREITLKIGCLEYEFIVVFVAEFKHEGRLSFPNVGKDFAPLGIKRSCSKNAWEMRSCCMDAALPGNGGLFLDPDLFDMYEGEFQVAFQTPEPVCSDDVEDEGFGTED